MDNKMIENGEDSPGQFDGVLKSQQVEIKCPYCQQETPTNATRTCSTKNILCCVFTTPIVWAVFQLMKKKDLNCYDAEHSCHACGKLLYEYHAC